VEGGPKPSMHKIRLGFNIDASRVALRQGVTVTLESTYHMVRT